MTKTAWGTLLLVTSALVAPSAFAQSAGSPATGSAPPAPVSGGSVPVAGTPDPQTEAQAAEQVEVSSPGGADTSDIVVVGRNIPQPIRATPEVISVLSAADIARTGEGDIAGALTRVTGLSVVGGRFVYIRGLGERYSLALLNGSPLPSPEPLRRVVPLDIFPTNIIASSVVQKTYSVNYPGEFGGGVINLTTASTPEDSFLSVGGSISGDTYTTSNLGYTYYGSKSDWTGFDSGARDVPDGLRRAFGSGRSIVPGNFPLADLKGFTASLLNSNTSVIQTNNHLPFNGAGNVSGGTSFDVGSTRIGLIATAGYNNSWRTRAITQQFSLNGNPVGIGETQGSAFQSVVTDNRIIVNGLIGLNFEFGENKLRFTNLYIRDTNKQGGLSRGTDALSNSPIPQLNQNSFWFERQLIDSQVVGEFKFDDLKIDFRGSYANAQRESPYERTSSYVFDSRINRFTNTLNTTAGGNAYISFSDLTDKTYGAGADVNYKLPTTRSLSIGAGYAFFYNNRRSTRRDFRFLSAQGALNGTVAQERIDYLLSDFNVQTYDIYLSDVSGQGGTAASFFADLKTHAGYLQGNAELFDGMTLQAGVRYESGRQRTIPLTITEIRAPAQLAPIENDYYLPAGTLTWNFAENMQLRLAASKTIARPQFREIVNQIYQDTESNRTFQGNQFLRDSRLVNVDARYEWYFARDQRFSLGGFYKRIDNPIETVAFDTGAGIRVSFLNAPKAVLYGGEAELVKYWPLDNWIGDTLGNRQLVTIANYTYTQSKLQIGSGDTITYFDGNPTQAASQYRDGSPLTGQSDHLVNVQLGLEDKDRLSQQTILLNYATKRVAFRGNIGAPDIYEYPGVSLDFVARQGVELMGKEVEVKFEARNITGTRHRELQTGTLGTVESNVWKVGTSFSLGAGIKF